MRFKKVNTGGYHTFYQCYKGGKKEGDEVRIARIDEPYVNSEKAYAHFYSISFVGGMANGECGNILKITNKIKKLAKEYRDNEKA